MKIQFDSIGFVKNNVHDKKDIAWGEDVSTIVINENYAEGLQGLSEFSHALIVYYLDKAQFDPATHLVRRPQNRDDMPLMGIFSQRAKDRPNPIGVTSVELLSIPGIVSPSKAWMPSMKHPFWTSSLIIRCTTVNKMLSCPNGSPD